MNIIKAGADYTFDIVLSDGTGGDFGLAGSTVTFVAKTPGNVTVLTQTLVVNIFGTATTSDGLAIGSGGHLSGEITQTLTAAQTAAFSDGVLTWQFTLLDSTGKTSFPLQGQWLVQSATYADAHLTRRDLRRRIADRLGDLVILEATSDSASTTTFVDALNISGAADSLTGRQLVVITGPNAGHVARIQASSESTNTITITPAADNTFEAGDQIDVFNERSRGWSVAEYNRVINDAINDTWPLGAATFTAAITAAFSADSPSIAVPALMHEVYEVAWQDTTDNTWIPLRKDLFYGWNADVGSATITIRGYPAQMIDTASLRISGYGPHPPLLSDTDATALHPEWLTAECAYRLSVSGLDRDAARGQTILLHQREREAMRSRIRTVRRENTVRVRG